MRYLALLTLLLGGCSWISASDVDCQLQLVDDDGDGFPLNEVEAGYEGSDRCSHLVAVDCDDADPAIFPGAEDSWYDGIDGDCALDDDYDQDLDGYVLDEYQGQATQGVDGTGELPGGDCDDDAVSIFPGSNDLAYDGVDSDCSGDDDYDQDADGYVADEYLGLATTYVSGSGSLPGGDCDDSSDGVNPAQADSWYDGVDTDCSGNDDYDKDADGYVADENLGLATTYVSGSGSLPGGDCDDADRFIYTGATDIWYDGIDSDCMGDDDYDQDVDGHRDAISAKDGDDCDDFDDSSYPGATEVFGDGIDHDCDGDADTFGLDDLDSLQWSAPQSLIFRGTDSEVFLGVTAEEFSVGTNDYYDSAIALIIDADDPGAGYGDYITWVRNFSDPDPNVLTPGCDLYPTDTILYGSVGIATGNTRQLVVRYWERATSTANAVNPPVTAPLSFDDLSLAMDGSGNLHAVGCTATEDDESMAYLWAEPATLAGGNYDDTYTLPLRARTCDLDFFSPSGDGTLILSEVSSVGGGDTGDTGISPAVDEVNLSVYTFGAPGSGTSTSFVRQATIRGYDPSTVQVFDDAPDRLLVITEPSENVISVVRVDESWIARSLYTVPNRSGVLTSASSALAPDGMLYVLATNDRGDLALYYGLPGVTPTMQQVDFDPGFIVDETAVWVDAAGSHLYLAARGYDVSMGIERVTFGYAAIYAP